jgi:hypothetical protein
LKGSEISTEVSLNHHVPNVARVVWHHTGAAGLIGIISNHQFWASSPMSMNDSSEIDYARTLLRERMEKLNFRTNVKAGLAADLSLDRSIPLNTFMICATEREDSLNQWMHYSGGGGYAVGVDTSHPLASSTASTDAPMPEFLVPGWRPVIYEPDQQVALIDNVLSAIMAEAATPGASAEFALLNGWRAVLGTVQLLLKHPAFAAEEEVRFLMTGDTSKSGNVRFRPGPRGVVPYMAISGTGDRLPLVGVYCGPGGEEEKNSAAEAVGVLMRRHGYTKSQYPIHKSKVPYRPSN